MLKKIFKISAIIIALLFIALLITPFLFKDKVKALVVNSLNEKVNAKINFADVDLSLLKSFPRASVVINNLSIINKAPFEGDTLFFASELNLKMSVKELLKSSGETINIQGFSSKNGLLNVVVNKDGLGNYDVALKDDKKEQDTNSFGFNIEDYKIENYKISYTDEGSKIKMLLDEINHNGKGNFAQQKLDLKTKTNTKLNVQLDSTNYMKNVALTLDAIIGIDLEKNRYTFKENKALINQLPLEFDGFLELVENGQLYELTFKTPTSDFKNFLGLVPEVYSGNINSVQTTGDFIVSGKVNGLYSEKTVPKFNIKIASNNASFKYPDLPKSVNNIVIDTHIVNETGNLNETFVNLNKLSFAIDKDVFNVAANIKNIVDNPLVNAKLNGTLNLSNLSKAYPIKLETPLSGILKADVTTNFDMKSVENSTYENIKNSGVATLTGFTYSGAEMAKPFIINKADVAFNTSRISLNDFNAKTGNSDLNVTGSLDNFYGFLFKNQTLKGNFNMNSNVLMVSDFMTSSNSKTTAKPANDKKASEPVKIPSFLDCTINAKSNMVIYDNLNLKDVSGLLIIKDEAAKINNLKMNALGGGITLTGDVSTKGNKPKFSMDLGLNSVTISEAFTQLDMLKNIAPIAGVVNGKLNSTIKLSGNLTSDMTPEINTMTGDLFGQLLSTTINEKNSALLSSLSSNVKFLDIKKLNLNDLKAALTFTDGKVALKPMALKYEDININIAGTHGFDKTMNYNLTFDVPAKYLGTEVNNLLGKLSASDQQKLNAIPVNATIGGNFGNPIISTDLKAATTNLVTQLVKMQKDKLIQQGTGALSNILGGSNTTNSSNNTIKDSTKPTTSTPKDQIKDGVKNALDGLFKKKKQE